MKISRSFILLPWWMFTSVFLTALVSADQLAYLSKGDAVKVAEALRARELVVTYCSECSESPIIFWLVAHAEARYTGHEDFYEVYLTGWPLLQSRRDAKNYEHPSQLDYTWPGPSSRTLKTTALDLAYTYVLSDEWWVCAGHFFGLECQVRIPKFRL
jgi:hypothetical protein